LEDMDQDVNQDGMAERTDSLMSKTLESKHPS